MQNRREFLQLLLAGAAAGLVLPRINFGQTKTADVWETEYKQILARIKPPTFKNKDYLITKFGAVADGKTLATDAIKKAIDECSRKGGGRVVVPAGTIFDGRDSFEIERQFIYFKRRDAEIFDESERLSAHCSHALGRNGIDAPVAVYLRL